MPIRVAEAVRIKDPGTVLPFAFDWSDELPTGAVIDTSSWESDDPADLVVDSDSETDTVATVVLSGGTAGDEYFVTNTIVTDGAATLKRTLQIKVLTR